MKLKSVPIQGDRARAMTDRILEMYDETQAERQRMMREYQEMEAEATRTGNAMIEELKAEMGLEGDWSIDLTYWREHGQAFMTSPDTTPSLDEFLGKPQGGRTLN